MNLYDDGVWNFLKNLFFQILNLLDTLQWNDFTFLELLIGFLMISSFLPVVLNLRNIDSAVVSGYSAQQGVSNRVNRYASRFDSYTNHIW